MFDAAIARLIVLTHAVCHALNLAERCAVEFYPTQAEGDDYWVVLGGGSVNRRISRTNLHDGLHKIKDKMTMCQSVVGSRANRLPMHYPSPEGERRV